MFLSPLSVQTFHIETCVPLSDRNATYWCNDILIPDPAPGTFGDGRIQRPEQMKSNLSKFRHYSDEYLDQLIREGKEKGMEHHAVTTRLNEIVSHWHWYRASRDFHLIRGPRGSHPLEEFVVDPPVTARFIRIVCTENMQGHSSQLWCKIRHNSTFSGRDNRMHDCIGFWEIKFS